ncbi:MAG: adenylate/guanylate cyclase domain-containing protein [Fibrobacteria bacterium]
MVKRAKPIFNSDYGFIQKSIPILGVFGVAGHICFYLLLHFGFRYYESLSLRLLAAGAYLIFVFYPRERPLTFAHKFFFEFANALAIPGLFTYLLLANQVNLYWYASLVFAGLMHGMASKPAIYFWSFPLASGFATWSYLGLRLEYSPLVGDCLKAQLIAYFMGLVATGLKTGMEITHEKILTTTMALAKAENDLLRAEETAKAYEALKKREELIRVFIRPSLVEEMRLGKDPSDFPPTLRNLSIMFCDIRDFTGLTETFTPAQKQTLLNEYFTRMTGPILKHGGEVDKIMGDCVMGIFPDGVTAAGAALGMRRHLGEFNAKLALSGNPPFRNGIGIAKGEVMLGNFGSLEKLDRTVIGDAVNIASRLESKTKMYGVDIVVTEEVVGDFPPGSGHFRWIDVVQVKGSTRHLKVYELYGHQDPIVRDWKDVSRRELEDAILSYFGKRFEYALERFLRLVERMPARAGGGVSDAIPGYFIERCESWIRGGAEVKARLELWDGVHVFLEK